MIARALLFALFFVSGFSALLYQVIWQRVLAIFSGADVFSITIVVTAFMGGLGCGGLAGGYLADRFGQRQRIVLFAFAELAVAVFAFFSLDLYYHVLYGRFGDLARSPVLLALVLFVSLLWPTFFMGMSLPVLARAMTRRVQGAAQLVGALYGVNTLGAAVGAMATTWLFMRHLGFEQTVRVGAMLNLCVALGALAVLRTGVGHPHRDGEPVDTATASPAAVLPDRPVDHVRFGLWLLTYAISGLLALSFEIVWFRLLGVMLKSTSFTFGHLLGIYLAGLTLGTFVGQRSVRRASRPAVTFLALQAGVSLYAGVSIIAVEAAAPHIPALWEYLGRYEPLSFSEEVERLHFLVALYVLLPAVLIGPPTVMMGLSFPFLQKVVQRDLSVLGRRVGWLQTANIFGAMLGAAVTGTVALQVLGTAGTLQVLVALGVVFLVLLLVLSRSLGADRRLGVPAGAIMVLLLVVAWQVPRASSLWATLHGTAADRIIHAEDASGLSLLKSQSVHMRGETVVYANGLGQSSVPFPQYHITLGLVPIMVHPNPERVAIVGLGSGATLYASGGRAETRSIHLIEIVASQLETLRRLHARNGYGGIASLLADPRVTFTFADARNVFRFGDQRYDVIEADALRPTSAYAGNLYSLEYFELVKRQLRPGGFAVTWAPTPRVVDTFAHAFPHATLYQQEGLAVLIGSDRPLTWRPEEITARLSSDHTRAYYARGQVDVGRYAEAFARLRPIVVHPRRGSAPDLNRDLFPRDEFRVPRAEEH